MAIVRDLIERGFAGEWIDVPTLHTSLRGDAEFMGLVAEVVKRKKN